ncbi:alpha amylase, catalytic domain protein [Gleimia coleocanis DSM 15436]|uniref:Alpha-1,4-glucan:maltose-1-phosphate maltosyltransferase n=1 Tax=Gleimia coleocanis DSM 15436 TaxID=525245 RepID=C0W016_9ACTO|nr:alpha-1,4-glucan--maltose-1-phosphate maltosyltransferase [Gleimia coleocanis]EEH63875.1 alpha amylase, catalytic domain protein [Gleimia coleocanis DSM 15436]
MTTIKRRVTIRKTALKNQVPELARITRIPATEVFPVIEGGLWAAKTTEGEAFPVRATVFREGHDALAAEAVLLSPEGKVEQRVHMYDTDPGLDRYEAWLQAAYPGNWTFRIDTWSDPYATWSHDATVKIAADTDVELMLEEGALLFERALRGEVFAILTEKSMKSALVKKTPELDSASITILAEAISLLRDPEATPQRRLSAGLSNKVRKVFKQFPVRDLLTSTREYPLQVDRKLALYGSWYEIFPRSYGAVQDAEGNWISGTLEAASLELPRISDMGFDVIYLTPIHPIGTTHRKGKNNTLTAGPNDPGSPYGIGAVTGGHDAVHPDLGTFEDFDAFVKTAKANGLEVALDLALQCSPDHPWVAEHPEWFTTRADGSIAYAENPPKKYQDIYPLNFDNDPEGIYLAIRNVVYTWIKHGVTLFRVDNPHTKPLSFWQRLLAEVRSTHPEVIFLAEAFTKPAMMRTLGAIGFHQSYTYFTWRTTKEQLEEYFTEVSAETAHLMRPAFWPTTHDILTPQMTAGGTAMFALRAVLAATAAPTWGIYSGYEFVEKEPRPGYEEQNDNEKYEYRPRDWSKVNDYGIANLLTLLNSARANHPALQQLHNLTIHPTSDDRLICFSKHVDAKHSATGEADTVIVVVNLDPENTVQGQVYLDFAKLGVAGQHTSEGPLLSVVDQLDGREYQWGETNFVELCPQVRTAHVLAVKHGD